MSDIAERISALKASIAASASRARRDPTQISFILVTKQVDVERIRLAYDSGHRDFGENRVQELVEKARQLPSDIRWHMIGHVQTNKAAPVVEIASLIHSVDSVRLTHVLNVECAKQNKSVSALIQVNTSGESTKYGIKCEEIDEFLQSSASVQHVRFEGLMTIGPYTKDTGKIRASFRELSELADRLRRIYPKYRWKHISMGMSDDYELGIEEGATLLRIGRAIFGARPK